MVCDDDKYSSRTLRLDTPQAHQSGSNSPYAPLANDNQIGNPPYRPDFGPYFNHVSSELSSDDLLGTLHRMEQEAEQRHASYSKKEPGFDARPQLGRQKSSGESVGEAASRERGTSVSFSSHATLDDGMRHSLNDPLPKVGSVRRRTRGTSITTSSQGDGSLPDTPGSASSPRINPFTGEPVRRRTRRTDLLPRLDRIESAQHDNQDPNMPSLGSGSKASPFTESVDTPLSRSMTGSMLLSPGTIGSPAVSPIMSTEPWPMTGRESLKSRNPSRQASLRNSVRSSSRRSSRMSGSSPASAFLSRWGQDSLASITPDPDEEGQTIGSNNDLVIGRQIGYGGFSVVKELLGLTEDGQKVRRAVKIVRKNIPDLSETENDKQQQTIENEVDVWRCLNNEYILPLHMVFHSDFATYCVMDLMEGGSLFELVRKSRAVTKKGLDVSLVKHYAHQLASALRYLHEDVRLVHRDVKLENCLLDLTEPEAETRGGKLKLCDFGLAGFATGGMFDSIDSLDLEDETNDKFAADVVGTLQYAAPENFTSKTQSLRPSSDVWAFGCTLYTMIVGDMPFKYSLQPRVVEMIMNGEWNKELVRSCLAAHEDCNRIIEVMEGCLELDPVMRWTIADVLSSSWLQDLQAPGDEWEMLSRSST